MDFKTANAVGKVGEAAVHKHLTKKGWLVVDTSSHALFQELGIDFVIQKGEKTYTIDVKTDNHAPIHFFLETVSNASSKRKDGVGGCFQKSKSDFWFYLFLQTNTLYVFNVKDMQRYVEDNEQFRRVQCGGTQLNGQTIYKSEGVLCPIEGAPIMATIKLK